MRSSLKGPAMLLLLAGCAGTTGSAGEAATLSSGAGETAMHEQGGDVPAKALEGVEWQVFEIDGVAVHPRQPVTIEFAEGRIAGGTGCNRFMGQYAMADGLAIELKPLATTMRACIDPLMEQEQRFLAVLSDVRSRSIEADGTLLLKTADGRSLRARRP